MIFRISLKNLSNFSIQNGILYLKWNEYKFEYSLIYYEAAKSYLWTLIHIDFVEKDTIDLDVEKVLLFKKNETIYLFIYIIDQKNVGIRNKRNI